MNISLPAGVYFPQVNLHLFSNFPGSKDGKHQVHNKVKHQGQKTGNELHVVLADDDEDDRLFFSDAITAVAPSLKLTTALDGEDLIKILKTVRNEPPDFIFLDLNMPYKNGLECLKEIKSSESWKSIPVIIYSTSVNIDQVDTSYEHGANLFIQKPTNHGGIVQVLSTIFSTDPQMWIVQPERENFVLK